MVHGHLRLPDHDRRDPRDGRARRRRKSRGSSTIVDGLIEPERAPTPTASPSRKQASKARKRTSRGRRATTRKKRTKAPTQANAQRSSARSAQARVARKVLADQRMVRQDAPRLREGRLQVEGVSEGAGSHPDRADDRSASPRAPSSVCATRCARRWTTCARSSARSATPSSTSAACRAPSSSRLRGFRGQRDGSRLVGPEVSSRKAARQAERDPGAQHSGDPRTAAASARPAGARRAAAQGPEGNQPPDGGGRTEGAPRRSAK